MSGIRDLLTTIKGIFAQERAANYRQVITGRYITDTTRQLSEAQWGGTKMYVRSGPTTRDNFVVNGCISSSDVWVWIVRLPDGEWYYLMPVVSKSGPTLGANLNSAVMPPLAGEAAPIIIGGKQFRPGLATASSSGGLYVKIAPFWYLYRGQLMYCGGDPTYDLSGSVPGSGLQRWAAIVCDLATGTLSTLNGSTQSTDAPLLESDIASIDTRGYLTLAAFQLAYGQTNAFATKSTMADIRPHFDSAVRMLERSTANVSSPPTDAELDAAFGTPAQVGDGFVALVDDNDADTTVYLVASNGTSWFFSAAMTKAT